MVWYQQLMAVLCALPVVDGLYKGCTLRSTMRECQLSLQAETRVSRQQFVVRSVSVAATAALALSGGLAEVLLRKPCWCASCV